jgi:acetyl esterase/lipase
MELHGATSAAPVRPGSRRAGAKLRAGDRAMHVDPFLFTPDAVDAATRASNEQLEKTFAQAPPMTSQQPAAIRAARASGQGVFGRIIRLPHAETRTIPGPAGEIPLRILRPRGDVRGAYLHFHGGGHVLGAEDMMDPALDALANRAGAVVVSVGYRLAPEHPYPAGPDDCEAAALWLLRNARRELGCERLAIGGESAGAHLSVATLVRLRDRHRETPFRGANLSYGIYDLTFTPSVRNWGERNLFISTPIVEWFVNHFVPDKARRGDPDVSPLYADLRGLPPALFTIGTLDPLLDDSLFMAARWSAAGNRAELAVYPGGPHGFTMLPTPLGESASLRSQAFVAELLREG